MLFLALQVEFITGFWTPIPAGAGGKLALAWLTGTGKRIAHPVIAQAELQPVLDFLELSEVMSQTSPRCQLAGPCCVRSPDPVVACSEPGNGSWERKDVGQCVAWPPALVCGHWNERGRNSK